MSENDVVMQETEWELIEALWELEAATAREVAEAVESSRGWAYSTVKTMLDRMVNKGFVDARRVGNVWEYTPAVRRVDAQRTAWRKFVGTVFGGSVAPALEFIAGDARLTRRQRDQLAALLGGTEGDDA